MNSTQVVTLRKPSELKARQEREAKYQDVSINYLATGNCIFLVLCYIQRLFSRC